MFVNSTSTTSGTATVENLTTGKTGTINLSSGAGAALTGQNAEWIVEDFGMHGGLVSFANFGDVTFTNCVAKTSQSTLGLSAATIIEMRNMDGQNETSVSVVSDSSVKVNYVNPVGSATKI